jgi:hypothetical protein
LLDRSVEVLFDTLPIEDVLTLGSNAILDDLIAQPTHNGFTIVLRKELAVVVLAPQHKVRMAGHLTHACEQTEDVRVVCGSS